MYWSLLSVIDSFYHDGFKNIYYLSRESVPTAVKSFPMKLVLSTVWIIKHQKSGKDKLYQRIG